MGLAPKRGALDRKAHSADSSHGDAPRCPRSGGRRLALAIHIDRAGDWGWTPHRLVAASAQGGYLFVFTKKEERTNPDFYSRVSTLSIMFVFI